jgi:hypothetical protein
MVTQYSLLVIFLSRHLQRPTGARAPNRPPDDNRTVQVVEIVLLALGSMVWPALIAVVVAALASPQPVRILSWFLAGSLLTTVGIGTVVVFVLAGSDLVSDSRRTFGAAVDLIAGAACLLIASVLWRRDRSAPAREPVGTEQPGWSERTLSRGGPLAFAAGIVLNVIPGVLPLVALKDIAELDYPAGATVALVIGFYLIMFLPAEVPLSAYVFAPERTTVVVGRFNTWLRGHARSLAVYVLAALGTYLVVRGFLSL